MNDDDDEEDDNTRVNKGQFEMDIYLCHVFFLRQEKKIGKMWRTISI